MTDGWSPEDGAGYIPPAERPDRGRDYTFRCDGCDEVCPVGGSLEIHAGTAVIGGKTYRVGHTRLCRDCFDGDSLAAVTEEFDHD